MFKNPLKRLNLHFYMSGDEHKCLQDSAIIEPMTAFKEDGSNLTITFLSLNRVHLSIKLINSLKSCLPSFRGKVLVVDNGSELEQIELLKQHIEKIDLDIDIKELGDNFGVARGRNISFAAVTTDWLMALDNDIYFVDNPLFHIKNCIDKLGVQFLNLPLLQPNKKEAYSFGGNLYFSPYKESYRVACRSRFNGSFLNRFNQSLKTKLFLEQPFLSTFLFGGASVIKKQSFLEQGGYDENMFIGYEDIDFSLRLYKKGIKIGNICKYCLVHSHEASSEEADIDYEKVRHSRKLIQASGEYFLGKHNLHVWIDDNWIQVREEELGLNS